MGVLVQVRDVPESVHRALKARAALAGVSLSEYLRTELQRVAATRTPEDLLDELRRRAAVAPTETSAQALRALRDGLA